MLKYMRFNSMEKEEIRSYINKIKLLGAKKCGFSADYWAKSKISVEEIYSLNGSLIATLNCYGTTKIIKVDKNTLGDAYIKLRCFSYKNNNNEEVFYTRMNSIYTHDTVGCIMVLGFDNGNVVPLKMDNSYVKVINTKEFGVAFALSVNGIDLGEQYIITKDLKWYKIEETMDTCGDNILHILPSNEVYKYEEFNGLLYGINADTHVL